MENIKKNPVIYGILSCAGCAVLLLALDFVLSLIHKRPFAEQISDPVNLSILIIGPIASGISSYVTAKKKLAEKKDE